MEIFIGAAIVGLIVGILSWNLRAGATAFALILLAIILIIFGVGVYQGAQETVPITSSSTPAPVRAAPVRYDEKPRAQRQRLDDR